MSRWKRISLLIIFTLIFGIIAFFHESRLGKWIDNEVYEFIYSSESFISAKNSASIFNRFNIKYATSNKDNVTIAQTSPTLVNPKKIDVLIKLSDEYINS